MDNPLEKRSQEFRLRQVGVRFGQHQALADIDLDVMEGEAVGLVGPSGAGKTTLLRVLCAAVRPTAGEVQVGGKPLVEHSPRSLRLLRSRIGFVHQSFCLVPNLRVVQNVLAGKLGRQSWLGGVKTMLWPGRPALRAVHELLERVGIPEKLYERTDRLSGGQQQRVAIARALYQEPEALLADEPVSAMDPARARDTIGLLLQVSRQAGLTLCVSLHDLQLARELLPRLVGMRDGRIRLDGSPNDFSDDDFHRLYDLSDEEMLLDGPGDVP